MSALYAGPAPTCALDANRKSAAAADRGRRPELYLAGDLPGQGEELEHIPLTFTRTPHA